MLALMSTILWQSMFACPHLSAGTDAQRRVTYDDVAAVVFASPTSFDASLESGDLQWVVTFRCRPAHDRPEYQVSLVKHHDGRVEAFAVELTASSLEVQLQKALESAPGATPEQVAQSIARREWVVQGRTSRPLARAARDFERLSFRVQRPIGMFMDQTTYRLWSRTGSQELYATIGSPSSGESSDPVVKWMQTVSRAIGIRGLR